MLLEQHSLFMQEILSMSMIWMPQWGEWHQGPDWVNGTIPVIATPGNHEYQSGSDAKRI